LFFRQLIDVAKLAKAVLFDPEFVRELDFLVRVVAGDLGFETRVCRGEVGVLVRQRELGVAVQTEISVTGNDLGSEMAEFSIKPILSCIYPCNIITYTYLM
jgi:hypothetical protein